MTEGAHSAAARSKPSPCSRSWPIERDSCSSAVTDQLPALRRGSPGSVRVRHHGGSPLAIGAQRERHDNRGDNVPRARRQIRLQCHAAPQFQIDDGNEPIVPVDGEAVRSLEPVAVDDGGGIRFDAQWSRLACCIHNTENSSRRLAQEVDLKRRPLLGGDAAFHFVQGSDCARPCG